MSAERIVGREGETVDWSYLGPDPNDCPDPLPYFGWVWWKVWVALAAVWAVSLAVVVGFYLLIGGTL